MNQNTNSVLSIDLKIRLKGTLPDFSWIKHLKWLLLLVPVAAKFLMRLFHATP